MKPVARWIGILVVAVLLAITLSRWQQSAASPSETFAAGQRSPLSVAAPLLRPAAAFSPDPIDLPHGSIALLALTEAARTTFVALDSSGAVSTLAGPFVVDERAIAWRGRTLAYLAMPGLDAAQNFVEVRDLAAGPGWRIQPEVGHAIFGFALNPTGARLVYLEVNVQVTGRSIPWWLIEVDLADGTKRIVLGGSSPAEAALLPIAWAGETMLLQARVPFTGERGALWQLQPGNPDAQPEKLADESGYVGAPLLSPGGEWAVLPVSDPAALPRGYDAGEPPANQLDLLAAQTRATAAWLAAPAGHVFAEVAWQPYGVGLWAIGGVWDASHNVFERQAVSEISLGATPRQRTVFTQQAGQITTLATCAGGAWLAVVQGETGAEIVAGPQIRPVARFPQPGVAVAWLTCLK